LRGPFGPSVAEAAYYALCWLLCRGQGALRLPQSVRSPGRTRRRSPGV